MSECSNSVGKGSIMYKCRISPAGHDGPCAAPELGRSIVERRAWEAQHASETTVATEPTVAPDFIETVAQMEREVTAPVTIICVRERVGTDRSRSARIVRRLRDLRPQPDEPRGADSRAEQLAHRHGRPDRSQPPVASGHRCVRGRVREHHHDTRRTGEVHPRTSPPNLTGSIAHVPTSPDSVR